jgi:RHS repeat-associated protein
MRTLVIAGLIGLSARAAWGQPFDDTLVQAPTLEQPQRGSIAGTLSKTSLGPSDLLRGSFVLGLSVEVPEERGPLLAAIFPSYSTEAGLTEWGMGWSADLAIRRHRDAGDLDYQSDGYTSPWGRLEQGDDGLHYPRGLRAVAKATLGSSGWDVRSPDGTVYRFRHQVNTPRGTYAWMLSEAVTVLGDRTTITWAANPTGQAFVERVRWGGRDDGDQYEAEIVYEMLAAPRESYASGTRMELDRRVSEIIIRARTGGQYAERWRYALGHTASPLGPAFYLTSVERRYASGQSEPTTRYEYDTGVEQLAVAPLVSVDGLAPLLAERGGRVLNPDRGAIHDLEENGLLDFEDGFDQMVWRQTAPGQFVSEELPPLTGEEHPLCRSEPSSLNIPRRLVRMHPAAAEPQVVGTEYSFGLNLTNVVVCDRTGAVLFNLPVLDDWRLGPRTRLTDVNGDFRPDLVRVASDRMEVLPNASEGAGAIAFGAIRTSVLTPAVNSDAVWLLDANGDGKSDLVKRISQGLVVWPGKGQGDLDSEGRLIQFEQNGEVLTGLDDLHFSFGDYNKDGLIDAVLSASQQPHVFINRGDRLVNHPVPVLATVPPDIDGLIVADLTGSGEEELVFTTLDAAFAVRLTSPSTGLMRQADDGKGTRLTFAYRRAEPASGVARRHAVLDQMTVDTAGYDPVTSAYDYDLPIVHSLGRYLVGFGEVTHISPQTTAVATFANDDDIAGLLLTSEVFDERTPDLAKIQSHTYEEADFKGVRWRRSTSSASGWRDASGQELVTLTRVLEYQRETCPTRVEHVLPDGTLRQMLELATVAELDDELHCLPATQHLVGTHNDSTRDFAYAVALARNELGQVTRVQQDGGDASLVLQDIVYDPTTHRVTSISAPGQGTQTFAHDATTGQLDQTTAADGVVVDVQNRDPRTDAVLELLGDHGPGGTLTSSFRYDGMERLASRWADFGGSSAGQPLETIAYRFPTADLPGLIQGSTLVDAASPTRREDASWFYPDGAEFTSATRIPGRWAFGAVSTPTRAELRTRLDRREPLLETAGIPSQTYGSLRGQTTPLGERLSAGFGHAVSSQEVVQQGVVRSVATNVTMEGGLLVTTSIENAGLETKAGADASGRVVWVSDQTNAVTQYQYDALGRLAKVVLADGTRQRLSFDAFGRPAQVVRDGIGTITYVYDPVTGRLDHKEYRDRADVLERTTNLAYDEIGRVVERTDVKASTGDEVHFTYRYDGDTGDAGIVTGQRGYTTQIEGPTYTTTIIRNPDGSEASKSTLLAGWMQIDTSTTYYAGGAVKDVHRTITRLSDGVVIDDVTTGHVYDAWGRPERITVNGETLSTVHYDDQGRLAWVDIAGDQRVDHFYDPTTHRQTGYSQQVAADGGGTFQTGVEWTFNDRGLIASEALDLGDQSWLRSYGYDPRGFLTRSEDADQLSTYSYTSAGLPAQVTDEFGSRTVLRGTAHSLNVAGVPYTWDSSGRVIARDDATFTYGPDGQLSEAHIGARVVRYSYDSEGNRILKFEGGAPVAAFIGGGFLTNDSFIAPVQASDRLMGILENGELHLLATDPRGTLIADRTGAPHLASPYGVRATRPDLSAALDYVEKGYDADLASVRMGVRDYDPLLGQFWTPDPLFLEAIDTCAGSPTECNLFSYALNNPIQYIDPTGLGVWGFIRDQVLPRVAGAAKVAAGYAGMKVGFLLCATAVGCVAGAPIMVASADYGASGIPQMWDGKEHPTLAGRLLGPEAEQAEAVIANTAALYGAAASGGLLPKPGPPAATELPELTIHKDVTVSGRSGGAGAASAQATAGTAAARGTVIVKPGKWDYFFGRVTSNPHNQARSLQNLRDLNTLGFDEAAGGREALMNLFEQGRRLPEVARHVTEHGVTITRTVNVGNIGAIDVKYFYPGANMGAVPEISTIIPKIFRK